MRRVSQPHTSIGDGRQQVSALQSEDSREPPRSSASPRLVPVGIGSKNMSCTDKSILRAENSRLDPKSYCSTNDMCLGKFEITRALPCSVAERGLSFRRAGIREKRGGQSRRPSEQRTLNLCQLHLADILDAGMRWHTQIQIDTHTHTDRNTQIEREEEREGEREGGREDSK